MCSELGVEYFHTCWFQLLGWKDRCSGGGNWGVKSQSKIQISIAENAEISIRIFWQKNPPSVLPKVYFRPNLSKQSTNFHLWDVLMDALLRLGLVSYRDSRYGKLGNKGPIPGNKVFFYSYFHDIWSDFHEMSRKMSCNPRHSICNIHVQPPRYHKILRCWTVRPQFYKRFLSDFVQVSRKHNV